MKKFFNKDVIIFFISFLAMFALSFYINIFTKTLFDYKAFGLNNLRCNTIWIGFSISWILFILLVIYLFHHKNRVKVLSIFIFLLNILFFAEISYVGQMGKYLIVSDLFVAGEGFHYIISVFLNMDVGMVITIIIEMLLIALINIIDKKNINTYKFSDKLNKCLVFIIVVLIISFRLFSIVNLGKTQKEEWMEIYNTKSIYENFTNPNTAMYITGFYEYHLRVVYKYFYNLIYFDDAPLKETIDKYNSIYGIKTSENEYTGVFKDKNVIFIMMESIDSWIIDDNTMPNLKHLMDTGLNFTNRYSPFFNGGQTINTEFALNTGMYAVSEKKTIYDIDNINYRYSLANMLKKNGYKVNSYHANTGEFYNRNTFHELLGYEKHYSAFDLAKEGILDNTKNYYMDSVLFDDEEFMKLFISDEKFLSFFTTYSAHLHYIEDNKIYKSAEKINNLGYGEEEYIYRVLAHDTDIAIGKLIKYLKKHKMLDNTVIVLASDHYVYGYSDSSYIAEKKGVVNDRKYLQNTPFVIWSSDIEHKNIDTILDSADILPTLLNMLDIKYDANKYLGTDVFSEAHDDFVWFHDGSYIKSDDSKLSNEAMLTKSSYNINKNRNILLTNYYG